MGVLKGKEEKAGQEEARNEKEDGKMFREGGVRIGSGRQLGRKGKMGNRKGGAKETKSIPIRFLFRCICLYNPCTARILFKS